MACCGNSWWLEDKWLCRINRWQCCVMPAGVNDETSRRTYSAEWYDEERYHALLHNGELWQNSPPICTWLPVSKHTSLLLFEHILILHAHLVTCAPVIKCCVQHTPHYTVTGLVSGKWWHLTPYRIDISQPIAKILLSVIIWATLPPQLCQTLV